MVHSNSIWDDSALVTSYIDHIFTSVLLKYKAEINNS